MRTLWTLDLNNYDLNWPIIEREAVRAVILREGKLALVHSKKFNDLKFPGGGMEEGEKPFDTLVREVREETGLSAVFSSIRPYGKAIEIRSNYEGDAIMHHTSRYYFCDVMATVGAQALDDYERERGFHLVYMTPREAYEHNSRITASDEISWLKRETAVLASLAEDKIS